MKHTPGPWEFSMHYTEDGKMYSGDFHIYMPEAKGACTMNVSPAASMSTEQAYENAQLIAAAPELLAALIELVELPNKNRPERVWKQAKEAVARAAGKCFWGCCPD